MLSDYDHNLTLKIPFLLQYITCGVSLACSFLPYSSISFGAQCLCTSTSEEIMRLLFVVFLLFSSSFCSIFSHQYYVSDNCSSVTYTPCAPLSVYFTKISQYDDTVFYFIGESDISFYANLNSVTNITLHGLDNSPLIKCSNASNATFSISYCSHIYFFNLSVQDCRLSFVFSDNITITASEIRVDSIDDSIDATNIFDVKVSSTIFAVPLIVLTFQAPLSCSSELPHYTMSWTNVTVYGSMWLQLTQGTSYNVTVILDQFKCRLMGLDNINTCIRVFFPGSFLSFAITNSSLYGGKHGLELASDNSIEPGCHFPSAQPLSSIGIENCYFIGNRHALVVKANSIDKHHIVVSVSLCVIRNNSYYGLNIEARYLPLIGISIFDTELTGNAGGNLISECYFVLLSNVTIANSLSTGLTLKGSVITVNNSLVLRNNTGVFGGGIAINDLSYISVLPQASFEFIDNHAIYKGGGIFSSSSGSNSLVYPFQYAYPHSNSKPSVPIAFWNNTAGTTGDDVYGFNIIGSNGYLHPVPFSYVTPDIRSSTDAFKIHFCNPENSTTWFYNSPSQHISQHIFPGQKIKFDVALFGYNGNYSSFSLTDGVVYLMIDNRKALTYKFASASCSRIEYSPNQATTTRHLVTLSLQDDLDIIDQIKSYCTIHKCPIGFSIHSSQGICSCSQSISKDNVTCDIVSFNITHNGLLWIGTNDTSTPFNANQTNPNACIINEDCLLYCSPNPVTFKMNDTDPQCVDDRGQVMCGSCRDGYSLLMGSNKCGHCDNDYMIIAWIALFAVMGILLVVVLIALNLTVSVGTLNGLLFYANIVKLYGPVFSRKGALSVLSQVISWINLDFGIEACFYNGMDSYAKQWLQFAFPLYLWMIIIVIIWLCRRYGKISRLMGSHAVPVLSTLFLLSYTKLVRTIVIVLHKRDITLHCINGSISVSKWYEDPNVDYAKGKHAGLFAFALFVSFVFVIPYTLFLSFSPLFEKYLSNYKVFKKLWSQFKPIIDAYSGPMKDEYRFWPGLLLVARLPILLSVTLVDSFIESHYFLLCVLLTVLAVVLSLGHCFGGFYRKRMNNMIEVWFLFNLCIMVGLSGAYNDDSAVLIWYNTCLSVFMATLLVIAVYHLYQQLSHMKCYDAMMKNIFNMQDDDEPLLDITDLHKTVDEQMREIVPTSSEINCSRESVVDLF